MTILLIIVGIVMFNLIIFAHEMGHFLWAKKFGVKVNEFALGMGPRIIKFKKWKTVFSLRAFPIGGFCEMEGEDSESAHPESFGGKPAWQRFVVVSFGAVMNLILGFLMTAILLMQSAGFASTTIANFNNDAISSLYLMEGDQILEVDKTKIYTSKDLCFNLCVDGKENFEIKVKRDNKVITIPQVNFKTTVGENGKPMTSLDFRLKRTEKNFWSVFRQTWFETVSTVRIVWSTLVGMITGRFAFANVSGPIGIASVIGDATTQGLKTSTMAAINNIIEVMAMITINLGIINLLPLPALDGGRLIFLLFEMITRKKVNPKYEGLIHTLGFFLFIAFTIYISYSDILKLLGKA